MKVVNGYIIFIRTLLIASFIVGLCDRPVLATTKIDRVLM